jgi:NADPH-dependent 2,4-dienoyl-CoA reductase/sulfur reductase-like enzyme
VTVVIVGASLAGLRCAQALRAAGHDGEVVLVGDEPHAAYDRPPLSKQVLTGEWDASKIGLGEAPGVDQRLGVRATDVDLDGRTVGLHGGDRLAFEHLVIATGASPRQLPGGEAALDSVFTLRTLDDSLAIKAALDARPRRVVVVGAGFIGAEVAAVARTLGLEVTILEALPTPLARGLGPTLGPAVAAIHADHGVDLRTGVAVDALEGDGRVERVVLTDGSSVDAEVVVVGIGVVPNTAWLEGSGLTVGDGVVCDATLQAAPSVWAIGDVARWPHPLLGDELVRIEHWTNAVEQGQHVGRSIATGEPSPFGTVPFVWSDQYEHRIQVLGRPGADDEVHVVAGSFEERRFVALTAEGQRLTGAVGMDDPKRTMRCRKALGGHLSLDETVALVTS